jgi:LmbE family N-acetylglucosaminyl deacetylase
MFVHHGERGRVSMKVLVINPHADDAEMCMGGTVAKVFMITFVIPCEDIDGLPSPHRKKQRLAEAHKAAKILGCDLQVLDADPHTLVYGRRIVQITDREVRAFQPDLMFIPWTHDTHQDHFAISRAAFATTRRNDISVLMYEGVPIGGASPDSFNSRAYVDITDTMDIKLRAIKAYASQVEYYEDLLDIMVSRAIVRGYQINKKYAEAFEPVRHILNVEGFADVRKQAGKARRGKKRGRSKRTM